MGWRLVDRWDGGVVGRWDGSWWIDGMGWKCAG